MNDISKEHLSFYNENGYCVVEGILSPLEREKYIREAERIVPEQEVKFAPVMNPDRKYPVFHELLALPPIVHCLEMLLNSKVCGLQSMFYYKPPGALGRDLHQDNFYAQAEQGAYIGTWLTLEDTDRENGGLIVYPGSHREPLQDIVKDESRLATNTGDFKNDRGLMCAVPPGYEKKYLTVSAGSAVFIHAYLIHGSEENLSKTRLRRVFAGHYIKEGSGFRPGTHAKRQYINLYPAREKTKRQ